MLLAEAASAICVQRFDDSRNSAIHTTYRISLRSSSLREPRYPLLRVVSVVHALTGQAGRTFYVFSLGCLFGVVWCNKEWALTRPPGSTLPEGREERGPRAKEVGLVIAQLPRGPTSQGSRCVN